MPIKLYFLLQVEPPTTFSADDEHFQDFYQNRYLSLVIRLKMDVPVVLTQTMQWLTDKVLTPENNEVRTEVNKEQRAFEDELAAEIAEAGRASRARRQQASRIVKGIPDEDEEGEQDDEDEQDEQDEDGQGEQDDEDGQQNE
jgi:hypothetical protein